MGAVEEIGRFLAMNGVFSKPCTFITTLEYHCCYEAYAFSIIILDQGLKEGMREKKRP